MSNFRRYWQRFWMMFSGMSVLGRFATKIACIFSKPYKARKHLARFSKKGFISPSAVLHCKKLSFGENVFIGDRVTIYEDSQSKGVVIGDRVFINQDTIIETGNNGFLFIGNDTHIQPRCQISAYKGSIKIGSHVQIAPACAFYPYDHRYENIDEKICNQPLCTRGGIVIEDDVWLGYGVIVLDGVQIGKGSIIGAGAVVNKSIPSGVIAAGVPAKVIKSRG